MNLAEANVGEEYIVKDIAADDEELVAFLFSLGCYSGEPITVVSRLKGGCVVSIKDGRYNIDNDLAEAILVQLPENGDGKSLFFMQIGQLRLTVVSKVKLLHKAEKWSYRRIQPGVKVNNTQKTKAISFRREK